MTTKPMKLFYAYAHEDEALRNLLNIHLSLLKRQGCISDWHDYEIAPGSLWEAEIDQQLMDARIILLLVSPAFMASDYCYGVEVQKALERQASGLATVIPVILRPVDWEGAPFGKLEALPTKAKAVTMWSNRDAAFADITKQLRLLIEDLQKKEQAAATQTTYPEKKRSGKKVGEKNMNMAAQSVPAGLDRATIGKAIGLYYKELKEYEGKATHELALRSAFQNLLAALSRYVQWTLIPEQTIEGGIRPDGVLRDVNNLRRGYWEAKGPASDLEKEIHDKIKKNYPLTNTVFENTRQAVLYQQKRRVFVCNMQQVEELKDLLILFFNYTEPHIEKFQSAVVEFKENLPRLSNDLLARIEEEHKLNQSFRDAFASFADICRTAIDPNISQKTIDEMLVQHLLTERIFRTVFNNSDFVNRNVIAAEIEKVIQALTSRSFNRQEFLKALDRYYKAIEGTAQGIESWSERQEFLNTVYEGFFQGFAVKTADTHGIVYTPQEIVDGKALMDLHLNYEQEKEYRLAWHENKDIPFSWRVEKMRLTPDKTALIVNGSLTLSGIPQACFLYRLGNRSALEWVIDQYQVSTDKRSGIVSDPNSLEDPEYIVRLIGKVITVSVETVKLVNELAERVKVEDWLGEGVEVGG